MKKKHKLLFPFIFLLTSCTAHLSEKQCLAINWYDKGYQDGEKGAKPRNLHSAISDCARFNLKVNTKAYHKGHTAGAHVFCRPQNGFNAGVQGRVYHHVCTPKEEKKFLVAYRRGLRSYCTPQKGYQLGRNGSSDPGFCAADLRPAFNRAYQRGHAIFNAVQALQTQVDSLDRQIDDLNLSLNEMPDNPKNSNSSDKQQSLQDQIDTLTDTKANLLTQLDNLRRQ